MLYRRIGNSGLYVSVIGLGERLTLSGQIDEESTLQCIKQAFDLGVNFFNTAEKYSTGQLEVVMGRAIKRFGWKRSDLVINAQIAYGDPNNQCSINGYSLSRKHVIEATLASLGRLGVDYVDIISAPRPDQQTPMEETVRAFNFLIENGRAFYWGTSMWSADEISEACRIAKDLRLIAPIVEQPIYNMLDRHKVEWDLHCVYSRCGVGFAVHSPLKNGIITGREPYKSPNKMPEVPCFDPHDTFKVSMKEDYYSNGYMAYARKLKRLEPLSKKLGVRLSHLALAWCLKNDSVASVIIGASHPDQVADNIGCLRVLPQITSEVMADIDRALSNRHRGPPM